MSRRILVLGAALTLAHLLTVTLWVGVHLGLARAMRDLPNRNPMALRVVAAIGDTLMLPTSVAWWLWSAERFPDSARGLLFTSPMWGFGMAYLIKSRRQKAGTG